jgi:outer membrane receptor protein involved in Fe transport
MYGEAFRSPNFGELYQDSIVVKGNADLSAECVKTIELNASKDFYDSRIGLTYFSSYFQDQISGIVVASKFNFINASPHNREGLEFELFSQLSANFNMKFIYSAIFNVEKTSAVAPDHKNLGSLITNYTRGKFNLNINGIYKEAFIDLEQESLFIFNSKLEYQVTKDFNYYLSVQNIGNKEYLNTTFVNSAHQTNRGREFELGFKAIF